MRVTFVRGIETLFFASLLVLVAALISMAVHHTKLENAIKPPTLDEWDKRDLEAAQQVSVEKPKAKPEQLKALGYEKPVEGALLPKDTLAYNDKASNLLNLLHYYYFIDEDRMLGDSVEYVDRETGYIKMGQKVYAQYPLGNVAKHVKYLTALAQYRHLYPTDVSFDEDFKKMDGLVKKIFETHPLNALYQIETFFDLLELNRLTGDQRYLDYANALNDSGKWENEATGYAQLVQRMAPRTLKPQFMYSVVLLDYYAKRGKPFLTQVARTLYDGIIADTYAKGYKMFYTQATSPQPGDVKGTALVIFNTAEQAIALIKMMDYYDATKDNGILEVVKEIVTEILTGQSVLRDIDRGGFYTKYLEKSSQYKEEPKRADVNLLLYSALLRYLKYDMQSEEYVKQYSYLVSDRIYDENYNGFYSLYDVDWSPKPVEDIYELSLSDAILGAQVFLKQEEIIRGLTAQGS